MLRSQDVLHLSFLLTLFVLGWMETPSLGAYLKYTEPPFRSLSILWCCLGIPIFLRALECVN